MYPNGTILTYNGQWATWGLTSSPDSLVNAVSVDLATAGLPVRSYKVNQSFGQSVSEIGLRIAFGVTLQLQVENGLGFNDDNAVIALIRDSVHSVLGSFPTADSLPYKQLPADSAPSPTGQPDVARDTTKPKGCISGTGKDTDNNFDFSCWFKNLTTQGLSTVGLLALVAVAGIGLLFWASGKARV